ncbi:hypothetical protein KGY73_05995 [bacterium]|nr:hypothetical protein [bacterium]
MRKISVRVPLNLWIPLFWGSLWGITEASLGHVFHMIRIPGLPGLLMFPAALFFMVKAYERWTGKITIFLTSLVAASFKFMDLMVPPHDFWAVLNPAMAILCESLALVLFLTIWKKQELWKLKSLWSLAVGWKILYALFLTPLGLFLQGESFFQMEIIRLFRFFIGESFLQGLGIYLWIQMSSGLPFLKNYLRTKKENYLG